MGARGSRAGELFWRSMGKRKRNRPSREPPSQKSIIQPKTFHSMFLKWLGLFLSVLVTASAVLPLLQSPVVQTPGPLDNGPLSLVFEVSNASLLPLFSFEGECGAPDGVVDSHQNTWTVGRFRRTKPARLLFSYEHTTVRCDSLIVIPYPIVRGQLVLRLTYFHCLWPFRWNKTYRFEPVNDGSGKTRWTPV